ncbi:piggyBac transposable element-derived protein 4-like isoform X1 [Bactrocera dorsalis]|uniref:PiggyBac transposable element-derived protein 4-like isoform X1 n=1 Tax=Bactrocera dorsalis TaxID=27457 RepID=A0ABM3JFR7_BACDO|nr:piggyBac transposable element-derived protein 4-like isoform X1 [Bactrocera dorsalis]
MQRRNQILSRQRIEEIFNDDDESLDEASDEDQDFRCDESEINESDISTDSFDSAESLSRETQGNKECFPAKDGTIVWYKDPQQIQCSRMRQECILSNKPGPSQHARSLVASIKGAFDLFISLELKQIIVEMTNLKGVQLYESKWEIIDIMELEAYFGLQIMAGVSKSNGESLRCLWDETNGRPIFRAVMHIERFMQISRCLRFDSHEDRETRRLRDKLAPIRNIWDKWSKNLKLMYNPNENVTVDEQLVPFRGRCCFRQYIPSKPAKYGIKIWALCDSKSNYAWNMDVYLGRARNTQPEKNQGKSYQHEKNSSETNNTKIFSLGENVVINLTRNLGRGYTVTCDNFFTTYNLAVELLRRKITVVGTVRKNKKFLPLQAIDVRKKPEYYSEFFFTQNVTVVTYMPKKYKFVVAMSTLHHSAETRADQKKKPEIIHHYNATKAGVDALDQLVATYTCKRQTKRWPVALFSNMVDVSGYNAYVIWTELNPEWNRNKNFKRGLFLVDLATSLVTPHIARRKRMPYGPAAKRVVENIQEAVAADTPSLSTVVQPQDSPLCFLGKRQRCFYCPHTKNSNKHSVRCDKCLKFICKQHSIKAVICINCQN